MIANAANTAIIDKNHAYPWVTCKSERARLDRSEKEGKLTVASWPGTCTFIPHKPAISGAPMSTEIDCSSRC